jgi:hypothetical protein
MWHRISAHIDYLGGGGGGGAAALPIIANNHSLFKIMQTFII